MVPNLTMLLDLKKPSHDPPKVFILAVRAPIRWSRIALTGFILLMLVSALIYQPRINENVDLLEMAPQEDTPAVEKMITYSEEFEGGQVGMILVKSDIAAEPEFLTPGDNEAQKDPFDKIPKGFCRHRPSLAGPLQCRKQSRPASDSASGQSLGSAKGDHPLDR